MGAVEKKNLINQARVTRSTNDTNLFLQYKAASILVPLWEKQTQTGHLRSHYETSSEKSFCYTSQSFSGKMKLTFKHSEKAV